MVEIEGHGLVFSLGQCILNFYLLLLLALTFLSLFFDPLGIYSGYEKVSICFRQLGLKLASCSTVFIGAIFLYVLFLHFKSAPKVCLTV
jgi:hypothetical protein